MAYLFDTDAISETLRKKPNQQYMQWLRTVSLEDCYTSAVVIGELYKGAYRLDAKSHLLQAIRERILPRMIVLPFDLHTSNIYGQISAELENLGQMLAHADLQIAATAIQQHLEVVTGNVRHFGRVPNLDVNLILADSRRNS
jgi:predicted nucleic acid-binding protein